MRVACIVLKTCWLVFDVTVSSGLILGWVLGFFGESLTSFWTELSKLWLILEVENLVQCLMLYNGRTLYIVIIKYCAVFMKTVNSFALLPVCVDGNSIQL